MTVSNSKLYLLRMLHREPNLNATYIRQVLSQQGESQSPGYGKYAIKIALG
jgi:hypothetical protein